MSNAEFNRNLFAARLRAMQQPNTLHIVGDSGAAVIEDSEGEVYRAVEVSPSGQDGNVHILFLNPTAWTLRGSDDPFRSSPSGSTSAPSIDNAVDVISEWYGATLDDESLNETVWADASNASEEVSAYIEQVRTSAPPYRIVELELTVPAAPTIWRGRTEQNAPVYIRYRHGSLRIHVGGLRGNDAPPTIERTLGGSFDSVLSREQLAELELEDIVFALDMNTVDDIDTLPTPEERLERALQNLSNRGTAANAFVDAMRDLQSAVDTLYDVVDDNADSELNIDDDAELVERIQAEQQSDTENAPWSDARSDIGFLYFTFGLGSAVNVVEAVASGDEEQIDRFEERIAHAYEKLEQAQSRDSVSSPAFTEVEDALGVVEEALKAFRET